MGRGIGRISLLFFFILFYFWLYRSTHLYPRREGLAEVYIFANMYDTVGQEVPGYNKKRVPLSIKHK